MTEPRSSVPVRPANMGSDLCWLLMRASDRQEREFEREALEASGLTARKHQVLKAALGGAYSQNQLARSIGVDTTTMVSTLDELERDGLAHRQVSPRDRRARMVVVTPAGQSASERCDKALVSAQERLLSGLSESDQTVLMDSLTYLAFGELPGDGH